MSIIVKDMKMPENCDVCMFSDWSNLNQTASCKLNYYEPCFAKFSNEYISKRAGFCPLVALPNKHGRLIDADAFKSDYGMKDDCADCEKEMRGKVKACEYDHIYSKMDFCGWLDDADVVIEAEDGT
jgi:hypothetical protein